MRQSKQIRRDNVRLYRREETGVWLETDATKFLEVNYIFTNGLLHKNILLEEAGKTLQVYRKIDDGKLSPLFTRGRKTHISTKCLKSESGESVYSCSKCELKNKECEPLGLYIFNYPAWFYGTVVLNKEGYKLIKFDMCTHFEAYPIENIRPVKTKNATYDFLKEQEYCGGGKWIRCIPENYFCNKWLSYNFEDKEMTADLQLGNMIFFVCDGYKPEMDRFYDNETEAELLLMYYYKIDSIKSGTSNSLGKFLGL